MNYQRIYDLLIEKARNRVPSVDAYYELHHILPKCLNGSNDSNNLIKLTPEEHYLAHQLLVKIHPENKSLVKAANMMTTGKYRSNQLYGWLKRKHSESMSGEGNHFYGRTHTPEELEKMRNGNLGKTRSDETREKISAYRTGKKWDESSKAKLSDKRKGCKGSPHSEESKSKISLSRLISARIYRISIQTPDGTFASIRETADHYGIDPATVVYRCKHWEDWNRT